MTAEHHPSGSTRNDSDGNNPPPPPDVKLDAAAPTSKVVTLEDIIAVLRTTHTPKTDFRLPRIELPKINGDLVSWSDFKERFVSMVHNNSTLQNVEKMHYLKVSLIGEAQNLSII